MTSRTTRIERLAAWAAGLRPADIPRDVMELCRVQRCSLLGSLGASIGIDPAERVVAGLTAGAPDGPAPLVGRDRSTSVEYAVMAMSAWSVAIDFDDYMCFGHTSHSAVSVPLLMAAETGTSGIDQLVAQAAANEIAARIGGACLIGPLNGQMWSSIHSAGAAIAAGLLLGLDARRLAHALAIALHQPPRPTPPGFMSSDSKLLIASEPAAMGIRAARLAAAGATGPLDVLDSKSGFARAFSYAFLPGLLGGLGEGWATRTLAVKPYPGCAYVDSTVDGLLELGPLDPSEVASVDIDAGLLTCGMDALSSPYIGRGVPSPVTINFSMPWTVAIVLLAGRLSPVELTGGWLQANERELRRLAARVRVRHDLGLTRVGSRSFMTLLPPRVMAREVGYGRLARAVARMRKDHPGVAVSGRDLLDLIRSGARRARGGDPLPDRFWDPAALESFQMTLPSRVTVSLGSGRRMSAEVCVPRGAPGHPVVSPHQAAADKLLAWGPQLWGSSTTEKIVAGVDSDADDLFALISPP